MSQPFWHAEPQAISLQAVASSASIDEAAYTRVRPTSTATSDKGAELAGRKARKKARADGIALFNAKPKKGIAQLQRQGLLSGEAADVAHFLRQTEGLDYAAVGDYLSDPDEACRAVRRPPALAALAGAARTHGQLDTAMLSGNVYTTICLFALALLHPYRIDCASRLASASASRSRRVSPPCRALWRPHCSDC